VESGENKIELNFASPVAPKNKDAALGKRLTFPHMESSTSPKSPFARAGDIEK